MNVIDILVVVLLLYGAWSGFSKGILVQLSGIVGLLVGAWVAVNFSDKIIEWFDIDSSATDVVVFVVITIVVMIAVIVLVRLIDKILNKIGLSIPLKILGLLVGVAKYFLIVVFLFGCYIRINNWIGQKGEEASYIEKSVFYKPIKEVGAFVFPFIVKELAKFDNYKNENIELKSI